MENQPLIVAVGSALFGSRWQSELARELEVSDRTVRRWAAGEFEPPPGVYAQLLEMLRERRRAFPALARRLNAAAHSRS